MVTTAELFAASIHDAKAIGRIASYYCGGYYSEGGRVEGYWCGSGADILALSGVVSQACLFHLLRGRSADGTSKLVRTQDKKSESRQRGQDRAGLDITMSVPKSVSILWAYGTSWMKREVELAFDRSCKEAFRMLEEHCLSVRTGKAGASWEQGKLIAAMFDHYSARNAHDPQLHRHFVIPNIAFTEDGRAVKLNTRAILPFVRTLGPLFRNILLSDRKSVV